MNRKALRLTMIPVLFAAAWIAGNLYSADSTPVEDAENQVATVEPFVFASTATGEGCPNVSCLTQEGYYECVSCPGCTCDPRNDLCVPEPPPPPPKTECPNVSCLSQEGYYECISCPGCDCHPQTDQCYGTPEPGIGADEQPYSR